MQMIMEDGFFNADPHQGNIFYLPGNRLGIIDFGIVGVVNNRAQGTSSHPALQHDHKVAEILEDWSDNIYVNR